MGAWVPLTPQKMLRPTTATPILQHPTSTAPTPTEDDEAVGGGKPSTRVTELGRRKSLLLRTEQRVTIAAYLAQHQTLSPATDQDCDCSDDLKAERTSAPGSGFELDRRTDYDPYLTIGDFNSDRIIDVAIVLVDANATDQRRPGVLIIFNGPFSIERRVPAYYEKGIVLRHRAMFHSGVPPHRLLYGLFESDNTCMYASVGNGYELDCSPDE